jgi:LysM repeat protein
MGYWGWRPLAFWGFISVIVVGCSVTSPITPPPSPTEYPPVTLTVRRLESPTPIFVNIVTLSPTVVSITPTETPTATISPTPTIYTVREGDTLLGIAISFGVDVGDLQAANRGIDPRTLQIGQQLIIPPPRTTFPDGTPSEASILPTPTPLTLSISPPTCYPTQGGGVTCLGEISNTLGVPLERVAVVVQLLNTDGTEEMVSAVEQRVIPTGNTAPFRAQFPINPQRGDYQVGIVVLSADEAKNIEQRFVALRVSDESTVYESGRYIVSARVSNDDTVSALAVRATLTVRAADGRVLGYRVVQVLDTLAPGQDTPVHVEVTPQDEDSAATHTLYIEAQRGS